MRNERGSILIFSYMVVAALVALGSALTVRTLAEQNSSSRSVRLASAFQTAEAGLDQALIELRTNEDWTGASGLQVPNGGSYDVAVTEDTGNPTLKTLTITGHYPSTDPTASGYQRRQIEAVVQISAQSVFQYGLFGDEDVQVKKEVTTDSYDSDLGDYEDQDPGDNGDVATNSTEDDCVSLAKDTTISGQVIVGPDMADPEDAVHMDDGVTITGSPQIASRSEAMELPAVTAPDTCGGDLKVDGSDTLSLAEASSPYCYSKLELQDSASIVVTGNVTVYAGELKIDKDAVVNADGRPPQLLFKVTSDKDVQIKNSGVFVGAIYAPASKVTIDKSGHFYGAAVGEEISVDKECELHYDEALANVGPSTGEDADALLVSWREL